MRIRRYLKVTVVLLALCVLGALTLFSAAFYTYSVLTDEALVAELRFFELGPQHFEAQLATDGGCTRRTFELYGDQWRLDARFLKWHSWATLLGFDAQYRLSRIEGRYADVAEQNVRPTVAYALENEPVLDLVDVADRMGRWNVFVDSTYGSSTFQTADPEYVHRVYRTQTGLIARREPLPGVRTSPDEIFVEISSACGQGPGYWQRFTTWIDRGLGRALGKQAAG
jgi:hypothetical protein